jgi:hypothetical protein
VVDFETFVGPTLVAVTSLGAWLVGTRRLGLPGAGLAPAGARMLEAIGLLLVFLALNLVVGTTVILAWRSVTGHFVSLYILNDATLGVFALVQALVFHWWWLRGRRGTE